MFLEACCLARKTAIKSINQGRTRCTADDSSVRVQIACSCLVNLSTDAVDLFMYCSSTRLHGTVVTCLRMYCVPLLVCVCVCLCPLYVCINTKVQKRNISIYKYKYIYVYIHIICQCTHVLGDFAGSTKRQFVTGLTQLAEEREGANNGRKQLPIRGAPFQNAPQIRQE